MNARIVFATNLRRIRKEKELSQEKLAEMCGLHRTYVSAVERGEYNIAIDNIERIAKALEVEPFLLLRHYISVLERSES